MSRKFRETKPTTLRPLEIAQSLRRGLVMGDGWIAAMAANLAMDHKQSKQVALNGAIVPSMDAPRPDAMQT